MYQHMHITCIKIKVQIIHTHEPSYTFQGQIAILRGTTVWRHIYIYYYSIKCAYIILKYITATTNIPLCLIWIVWCWHIFGYNSFLCHSLQCVQLQAHEHLVSQFLIQNGQVPVPCVHVSCVGQSFMNIIKKELFMCREKGIKRVPKIPSTDKNCVHKLHSGSALFSPSCS